MCLSIFYLFFTSFSLTSFRFHYLSGLIPLAPIPCGVFGGGGGGGHEWGRPGGGGGGGPGGEGPGEGELDGCIMHRVCTSIYITTKFNNLIGLKK